MALGCGLVVADIVEARPKTDVITLENGDRITCAVVELARGKLTVKTSRAGTLEIEWAGVVGLQSDHYFRVEDRSGTRSYGTASMRPGGPFEVRQASELVSIAPADVVEIRELERSFWSKMDGSLSFGFSFTKASNVAQLTLDWANLYRDESNFVNLSVKTILTDKGSDAERAVREDVSIGYTRLLRARWTGTANSAVQRNDELSLARRFLFGAGSGVSIIKNNLNVLLVSLGVALNSERATNSDDTTQSMEGVFAANYSLFKYETPKSDVTTSFTFYPSITEKKRYRIDFDVRLRHELIKDLFANLSYYTNFDSQAPSGEGRKSDLGVVTSVGWSY